MEANVKFRIEPQSDKYDHSDDRWIDQVSGLKQDVRREVGGISREVEIEEGKKGGVESIILALGSAGAITAAVDIFKAWLSRDRTRSMEVSFEVEGRETKIKVSGTTSDEDIRKFMEKAFARTGG